MGPLYTQLRRVRQVFPSSHACCSEKRRHPAIPSEFDPAVRSRATPDISYSEGAPSLVRKGRSWVSAPLDLLLHHGTNPAHIGSILRIFRRPLRQRPAATLHKG